MNSVVVVKRGPRRAVIAAGLRGRVGEPGADGTPFQVDASGLLANRGAFDAEEEGFSYLATDTGDLYFRQGAVGSWSDPVPFQGPPGDSAYQIAVSNGFVGTELEWLAALEGTDGTNGTDGLSIVGASIDGGGHLLLTLSNSTVLDAGYVVGPAGANGVDGTNGTDGVDGAPGTDGADGRGIASMAIDGSNHLIITYTDSTTQDAGLIPGAGGSAAWGSIGGTLADQTDLVAALADKANSADLATVAETGSYDDLADKPTIPSSAAEVGAIPATEKGAANGVAPLDSGGKVASAYLPSFVDDVLEFANLAAFPVTGESGKIYVALDSNKTYRWGGSAYVEINPSPGSTDAVPEGATNLYHTAARVRAVVLTGLSLADSTEVAATDSVLQAIGKLAARLATLQTALDGKAALIGAPIVTVSGTTYTLTLADAGKLIEFTNSSAITVTVPAQSSVAFTGAEEYHLCQAGTGKVSVSAAGGVTLVKPTTQNAATREANSVCTLKRRASDSWRLLGDLEASA